MRTFRIFRNKAFLQIDNKLHIIAMYEVVVVQSLHTNYHLNIILYYDVDAVQLQHTIVECGCQ